MKDGVRRVLENELERMRAEIMRMERGIRQTENALSADRETLALMQGWAADMEEALASEEAVPA